MRGTNRFWRLPAAALALLFCLGASAHADTIVLKNGRRIVGSNISRADGKVSCDTPAGRLTVPESLVERIEKDGLGGNPEAEDLNIAPPAMDLSSGTADEVARAVVRGSTLDRDALAHFDAAGSSGSAEAAARAALAESAASRFEFSRDDLDAAMDHANRAVEFAPSQLTMLLNAAYLHQRRGEYSEALALLQRAGRIAPDSPDVAKLTGWADYGLNRLPEAISEWKRAQSLRSDPEVAQALEKAQRDLKVEGDFSEGQSEHFLLRYDGAEEPDLARAVLPVLEDDFREISSKLNYTPSEPIAVILYTNQAFADVTQVPGWVGALNDGRIRVPVQGLATVTPQLASVLKHELTHSFINGKTNSRCPVWLQEGIAQWMEGKRSWAASHGLIELYQDHQEPSLAAIEGSWLNLPSDYVGTAYAWSLAVVESVEANGSGDIARLLDSVATERNTEAAVRSSLHMSYDELNASTFDYLRSTYVR